MDLRSHQAAAVDMLRESISRGHRRPILFAPCAFGKTICAAHLSALSTSKGNKVLFIVHRRLLAEQTKEKFDEYGIHNSIIMAGYDTDFTAPVMITTHQTYNRRLKLAPCDSNKFFHDANLLIVDECHLGISPSYTKIYDHYDGKVVIGLTGSPARSDQRGLGEVFDDLVESTGIAELTESGYLTKARYFAPTKIDMSDVPIVRGDFSQRHQEKKLNTEKLNGDILDNWLKNAPGRQTIIFASGVKHSKALKHKFENHGIRIEHLDAHSPEEERERVLRKFRDGDIQVVTNCQLFTEGYDADFASCIVLARGTKSYPLYVQMCGRGQRIFEGKEDFIILDHGGNIERFGFISDPVEWTLSGKDKAWKKSKKKKERKIIECQMCGAVYKSSMRCPECGYESKNYGRIVECTECDLEEVGEKKERKLTTEEKRIWFGMFDYERRRLGKNERWLLAQYKSKTGVWPRNMDNVPPIEPSAECRNWLTYQRIKWVKGQGRSA